MTREEQDNLLRQCFIGEEVEVLVNLKYKSEESDENGSIVQETPLAIRGFLLEIGPDYLFLGDNGKEINKILKFNQMVGIELIKYESKYDEVLENFPVTGSGN